jgi:hypothetical protein
VTPKFLPILIPSDESEADGTVNGTPARVVSYDIVDLLIENPAAFHRKYGGDIQEEQKRLRGFLQIVDAVRGAKRQKLEDVALQLARLTGKPVLWDEIQSDPLFYVSNQINGEVDDAKVVLWQGRSSSNLSAGIFCEGGMLHALYILTAFRIGIGLKGGTGSCVICGKTFERTRGDRRKTCSDRCRKQASRMKAKASRPRPAIRRRRSAAA